MERVLLCLVGEHDPSLVLIAGIVCFCTGLVAFDLLTRARAAPPRALAKSLWVAAAGFVAGSGIWATHFIAILAYDPATSATFSLSGTAFSGISGIVLSGCAFTILIFGPRRRAVALVSGALLGGGVAVLHYVGMAALALSGGIAWHRGLVALSILVGCVLGAVAGERFTFASGVRGRLLAALAFTLAVCLHHFIGMGAVEVLTASAQAVVSGLPRSWLAGAIVAAMVAILGLGALGIAFDRSMTLRALREAARMNALANSAFEGIAVCRAGVVVHINESFCALLQADRGSVLGTPFDVFVDAHSRPEFRAHVAAGDRMPATLTLRTRDGTGIPAEVLAHTVIDDQGAHEIVAVRDLRQQLAAEARIRHLAHYDALTSLANRSLFRARMDEELVLATRAGGPLALLYIDLDRFKEVNDTFGHLVGDGLLCEIARRLERVAEVGDVVARLAGDEFVFVTRRGAAAACEVAEQIVAALALPVVIDGCALASGASLGVAIFPQDGGTTEELLRSADMALYRAKAEGKGTYRTFDPSMAEQLRQRRAMQRDLEQAIQDRALTLVYQPQVRVTDRAITGFEVLVRWTHPEHGPVPPSTFIPLAEEAGLIGAIGELVLCEACAEAASWAEPLSIAVNLSPLQIAQGDLPALVQSVLLRTGLAPSRLELEITEGVLIQDINRALHVLRQLKAMGVRIAMDDFGTGFSSLSYLQKFPFDKIKIDGSFVTDLDHNGHSRAIVRAVLGLGRSLSIPVIAEGVETGAQLDLLQAESCNEVQGYLTGRPAPIASFAVALGRAEERAEVAA
jgi:diguanylate cyclase (GGDEF)-like protein